MFGWRDTGWTGRASEAGRCFLRRTTCKAPEDISALHSQFLGSCICGECACDISRFLVCQLTSFGKVRQSFKVPLTGFTGRQRSCHGKPMANARISLGLPYIMTYRGAMSLDSGFCLSSPNLRRIRMHAEQLCCNPRTTVYSAHFNDMMLHVPILRVYGPAASRGGWTSSGRVRVEPQQGFLLRDDSCIVKIYREICGFAFSNQDAEACASLCRGLRRSG